MMRRGFWLATILLPLGGCYVAPPDPGFYGYAQPGYPAGGYPQAPYGPYAAYPDSGDYQGGPTIIQEGSPVPLVMFGGEWGFYDSGHRWHRAPEDAQRHLQERRAAEGNFHHDGAPRGEPFPQRGLDEQPAHPGERPGGRAAFQPPGPAAVTHPAPASAPAAQQRPEPHEPRRACPPGQRC